MASPSEQLRNRRASRTAIVAAALAASCTWTAEGSRHANAQIQPRQQIQKIVLEPAEPVQKIEDPAELKRVFEQLVVDLGSNDFAVRQRATEKLAGNEQFDLPLLEDAIKRSNLTLEARTRLLAIARQRFGHTSRAALGFQFGGAVRDRCVVGQTFPRFESHKLLEEGDMIISADGFKIEGPTGRALLQSIIISHDPGEKLKLVIRRGKERLNLDVTLGKFADLDQGGVQPLMDDRLTRAWRIRAQSRLNAAPDPVRVEGAPVGQWGPSEDTLQRKMDRLSQRDANESPIRIAGGGMPRAAQSPDDNRLIDPVLRQQLVLVNGQARWIAMNMRGLPDLDQDLPGQKPEEELAQLLKERMDADKLVNDAESAKAHQPEQQGRDLTMLKKNRDLIAKQMDAIQAEIDDAKAAAKDTKRSAIEANAPSAP